MDSLRIHGGVPLTGRITVSGAKNAALPLMAAGLATSGTLTLENVPHLVDTASMEALLANHGLDVVRDDLTLRIGGAASNLDAPYDLVRKMRASVLVLGPLLGRYGEARVSLPGGCAIGTRPVDLHIRAMQALGAVVRNHRDGAVLEQEVRHLLPAAGHGRVERRPAVVVPRVHVGASGAGC